MWAGLAATSAGSADTSVALAGMWAGLAVLVWEASAVLASEASAVLALAVPVWGRLAVPVWALFTTVAPALRPTVVGACIEAATLALADTPMGIDTVDMDTVTDAIGRGA